VKTFEISYLPLHDAKGRHNGLTIILHDVTEKKINQAKLLEQEKKLAILDERERLVRDLHDNLGQVLGFINVQAQAIKRELKVSGLPVAKLERLIEVAQSAHQDMRTYIIKRKKTTDPGFYSGVKEQYKTIYQPKRY
jgi:signal transduction histidine kinase